MKAYREEEEEEGYIVSFYWQKITTFSLSRVYATRENFLK